MSDFKKLRSQKQPVKRPIIGILAELHDSILDALYVTESEVMHAQLEEWVITLVEQITRLEQLEEWVKQEYGEYGGNPIAQELGRLDD